MQEKATWEKKNFIAIQDTISNLSIFIKQRPLETIFFQNPIGFKKKKRRQIAAFR